jgi:hypothetical protein
MTAARARVGIPIHSRLTIKTNATDFIPGESDIGESSLSTGRYRYTRHGSTAA